MTRGEFRNEYTRLANGFGRGSTATDERLAAMYDKLSHYSLLEMVAAVEKCLLDMSMPSFDRLHGALDWAKAQIALRGRGGERNFAARVMDGVLPRPEAFTMSREELAGCKALKLAYVRAWDNNISPRETIEVIRELAKTWPWVADEIPHLEAMGDHWRNARGESTDDHGEIMAPWPKDAPGSTTGARK